MGRPGGDGVQNLLQWRPVGDRPLQLGQLLQEPLAFLEFGPEPALLPEHAQLPHHEREHPAHPPQQVELLGREAVAGSRHQQLPSWVLLQHRHGRVAGGHAGKIEQPTAALRHQDQVSLGCLAVRKPDGSDQPAAQHDSARLAFQRLGGPLDGNPDRRLLVGARGDGGEELGELLGRPEPSRGQHVSSAREQPASGYGTR